MIEPKEKALELIDRFRQLYEGIDGGSGYTYTHDFADICTEEILSALVDTEYSNNVNHRTFWGAVQVEITKDRENHKHPYSK